MRCISPCVMWRHVFVIQVILMPCTVAFLWHTATIFFVSRQDAFLCPGELHLSPMCHAESLFIVLSQILCHLELHSFPCVMWSHILIPHIMWIYIRVMLSHWSSGVTWSCILFLRVMWSFTFTFMSCSHILCCAEVKSSFMPCNGSLILVLWSTTFFFCLTESHTCIVTLTTFSSGHVDSDSLLGASALCFFVALTHVV